MEVVIKTNGSPIQLLRVLGGQKGRRVWEEQIRDKMIEWDQTFRPLTEYSDWTRCWQRLYIMQQSGSWAVTFYPNFCRWFEFLSSLVFTLSDWRGQSEQSCNSSKHDSSEPVCSLCFWPYLTTGSQSHGNVPRGHVDANEKISCRFYSAVF